MEQYPYYLYTQESGETTGQNYEGDFDPVSLSWILHSKCRDEVNGKGETRPLANGENFVFSAMIYLPKFSNILPEGRTVLVSKEKLNESDITEDLIKYLRMQGKVRSNGILKGFEESRLNVRLWL